MLRPAKLFQPIYQLRQYVQHKIAELVVQQSIITTSIQQITATATVSNNVLPVITHQQPKPLIQNIQKQFPMINKACSPFLRITPTATSIGPTQSLHYLRHQSQPAIGTYRAYSSSSTAARFMNHMYISPSSTNPSVFSHLSSNGAFMKTPLGQQWSKFNHHQYQQKNHYEESPIVTYTKQEEDKKEEEIINNNKMEFKKFNQPIINKNNHSVSKPIMKNNNNNIMKNEKEDDVIDHPIEMKKEKKNNNNNNIKEKNQLCLQKDDDMMTIHSTNISTNVNYYYIHVDLLPPPNTTSSLFMSMSSSSSSTTSMNKKEKDWLPLSQDLMSFFISWKKKQQKYYQHFIQWIQFFVDKQFHFSITNGGQSLRLYFPKHVIHKEQALSWLYDINQKFYNHLQQKQHYKNNNNNYNNDNDNDEEVLFPHWSLHHETRMVQEPLLPLGPDYFQGLQLFLDEVDDLFHHGPAFSKINHKL